jgi:hypothetical protein
MVKMEQRLLENNGFNIIEGSDGTWTIACKECGRVGQFSSYGKALENTARRCCEPGRFLDFIEGNIPFSGEPATVEDDNSNGLALHVDY